MSDFSDEHRRIDALHDLNILDTEPELIFDSLVELAKLTFDVPVALISLVAADRQWFKARIGLSAEQTERKLAFCDYAIRSDEVMVVPDASLDPRFRDNPLVAGEPGIRFYAAAPLKLTSGFRVGTVCIIDHQPHEGLPTAQSAKLQAFARTVVQALEMRARAEQSASLANEVSERQGLLGLAEKMSRLGTWSWDPAANRTSWSAETYRIHGFDPSQPPPDLEGVLACYHPEDAPKLAACVERAVREGVGYDLQARIVRPTGEIRQITTSAGCRLDAEGRLATLFGSFQDITDLKLMDQALKDSEAKYRMLAENIGEIIVKTDLDGVIDYASPSIANLLGIDRDDILGKPAVDLGHFVDRARIADLFAALRDGSPLPTGRDNEFQVRRADGSMIWLQGTPSIVRDEAGEPAGLMSVVRDVTDRRAIEDELLRKTAEAEAAAVAKSEFLANMSHEIRTPLTGILGFAGMLDGVEGLPSNARTYVDRIVTSGQALLSVVNDILDFSKLDADRLELDPHPFDPAALVNETLALVSPEAARKALDLKVEFVGALPSAVFADSARTRQVLLNLLSNAVKFTDAGSVTVTARYVPDGRIRLEVRDTGMGIPQDRLDRLFQRFSQIDGSNTRQHGGTGLGLAISKRLTELMGGEIGVQSQEGQGSTFWFTIQAPPAEVLSHAPGPEHQDFGDASARILVVDDVAMNRELVRTMLAPFGLELVEASSGAEAVNAAMLSSFDLILMDLQMPGMDGLSATRAIRQTSEVNRQTPIVALSANVLPQHLAECAEAGMDDHIAKPISVVELLTKIAHWTAPDRPENPGRVCLSPDSATG